MKTRQGGAKSKGSRMKYRLLCADLDGTLLTSRKTVSERTRSVLVRKQEEGLVIALASGRTVQGIMPSAGELRLESFGGYVLAFNGGRIVECATGRTVRSACIPDGAAAELFRLARSRGCDLVTYVGDDVVTSGMDNPWARYEARCNGLSMRESADFSEFAGVPLNKCLMAGPPETISLLAGEASAAFGADMEFYRSEPFFLECVPRGVDKGSSLALLAGLLGIHVAATIAFGDGYNDISMLRRAGLGVAMANAREEVRAAAGYVAASNDEDGLALAAELFCV